MLFPTMRGKRSGYSPTASLAAQHDSSAQHAAHLSSNIPYPPYYPNHQAIPPSQMYNSSAANPYLNHYIPGLTTSHDGPSAPVATSTSRDYSAQYPRAQHTIPGISAHSFQQLQKPSATSEFDSQSSSFYKGAPIATEAPAPLVTEVSSDAMDLDTREEGELSSGDMEEGETLTPDSATISPNAQRQHGSHLNNNSRARRDSYDADMTNSTRTALRNVTTKGIADSKVRRQAVVDFPNGETTDNRFANVDFPPQSAMPNKGNRMKGRHLEEKEKGEPSLLTEKNTTQLRLSAQGALLNLAPHNIRFDELVKEGIDPVLLRLLYDEIGIKVVSEPPAKSPFVQGKALENHAEDTRIENAATPTGDSSMITNRVPSKNISRVDSSDLFGSKPPSGPRAERKNDQSEPLGSAEDTNPPANNSNKRLERKDLIARMLAAKAAKPTSLDPMADEFIPANQTPDGAELPSSTAVHSAEPLSADGSPSTRAKEKSRAQTELARQRMEQLKKQGLGKLQTQPTNSYSELSAVSSVSSQTPSQPSSTLDAQGQHQSLKHPLPDRPPDPSKLAPLKIPGLFMTSSEPTEVSESAPPTQRQNDSSHQSTVRLPRKRPRASDFTDDTYELSTKKQTPSESQQASSEHKVIIDLSDDEAMDSSDDDMQVSSDSSSSATSPNQSFSKPLAIRDQPLLRDFPSRTTNSSYSTPVPGNEAKPGNLLQKNIEIQAMRQRIAELERRRAKKKDLNSTQELTSNIISPHEKRVKPQVVNGSVVESENDKQSSPGKIFINSNRSVIGGAAPETQPAAIEKLVSPSLTPLSPLNSAEPEDMKKRSIRRQEIETGLPALDAELIKSEARLAQYREEEKKLLAEISKGREGRRLLLEELKGLGIETVDASQGQPDSTVDKSTQEEVVSSSPVRNSITNDDIIVPDANPSIENLPEHIQSPITSAQRAQSDGFESGENEISNDISGTQLQPEEIQSEASRTSTIEKRESRESSYSSSAMDESMDSMEDLLEDQQISEEETYTPTDSIQQMPHSISVEAKDSQPGSVPGSPKPSEIDGSSDSHRESSVVSDTYEPPEPAIAEDQEDNTPPFSPAPPETDDKMDIDSGPSHVPEATETLTLHDQGPTTTAAPIDNKKDVAHEPPSHHESRFSPYQSPLGNFKAYRYHPQFKDNVDGGFRSLTFSHNIDPDTTLCGFELSGGVCNDRSCPLQHFRDMSLSDDKILVEMGSLREGKTPTEQEEYVAGLRQIINDMRRDKVKDFTTVATEIAAYRRRFLQDPSRVLAL